MNKVKVKVQWARTVICETVVEVNDDPNLFEYGEFIGGEEHMTLPSLFNGKIPEHVTSIVDDVAIWDTMLIKEVKEQIYEYRTSTKS